MNDFIGIDFGTSNSLAATATDTDVEFVTFPDGKISTPTVLYFPQRQRTHYIGIQAIIQYLEDCENDKAPGRLMQSIKSLLPEENYDGTAVQGHGHLDAPGLVTKFLGPLKDMAEHQFGTEFSSVVMGRPVEFSKLAMHRLEKATKDAGFKEVIFWYEPVAAAIAYESTLSSNELTCVIDLGGGTSDVCIIELSPDKINNPDRLSDIKAVGGVAVAGDELNSRIMRQHIAKRFGSGSTFLSLGKTETFPTHIIGKLSAWHRINLLWTDLDIINSVRVQSDSPKDVDRLLTLIQGNFGFKLFQSIDQAKRELSEADSAEVRVRELQLHELLKRTTFEELAASVVQTIYGSILDTLVRAGVTPDRIDSVVLTGGTAQVPIVALMIQQMFKKAHIVRPGYFNTVAAGLARIAHRIK